MCGIYGDVFNTKLLITLSAICESSARTKVPHKSAARWESLVLFNYFGADREARINLFQAMSDFKFHRQSLGEAIS